MASRQNVWVDAVRKGQGALEPAAQKYQVKGLLEPQSNAMLYGVGSAMTLQKQDYQGLRDAYIYDVRAERFVKVNSMNYARWYPTLAEMGNGMVMTMTGLNEAGQITMNSEMFNPADGRWTTGPSRGFPTYPATFLTEDGQLFFTGSSAGYGPSTAAWRTPGFWNTKTGEFRPVPGIPVAQDLETSASVLLPPAQNQKIMVMGGGGVGQSDSSTARTALLDMAAPDPRWVRGPDLAEPTRYPITVLLPTDQVLVTGGSRYYRGMHGSDNRDTRIYDVATNSFSWAADSVTGRDYHSGGILLPNGSVLTLGGNPLFGNKQDTTPQTFNQEIDVYFPPYMFQGRRPAITSAPKVMARQHSYLIAVPQAASIRYLRLMRPDNPTHVTDVNERSVAVSFTQAGHGELKISLPSNANLLPPSYYMLFASTARASRPRATGSGFRKVTAAATTKGRADARTPASPGQPARAGPAIGAAVLASAVAYGAASDPPVPRLYAYSGNPVYASAARLVSGASQRAAAELQAIARTPAGIWVTGQSGEMTMVRQASVAAGQAHAIPVIVAYNLPDRDACGKLSARYQLTAQAYRAWIDQLAGTIGTSEDIVVVEPDGLPDIVRGCLDQAQRAVRYRLLRYAMRELARLPHTRVYLDAGNPGMFPDPAELAAPLTAAGVRDGRGFSANVSNFQWTASVVTWSQRLEHVLGGPVGAVIDTSRNGRGPYTGPDAPQWCNPPGRAFGPVPALNPGPAGIDAYLWIKDPGASDGTCRGGPPAGQY